MPAPAGLNPGAPRPRRCTSAAPCSRHAAKPQRLVATGASETAKLLAVADLQVAQRSPRLRDAAARPKAEQYRGLFGWLRASRYGAQARNDQPLRRFFLFRSR